MTLILRGLRQGIAVATATAWLLCACGQRPEPQSLSPTIRIRPFPDPVVMALGEQSNGAPTVLAKVNGVEGVFLVDTGSSFGLVFSSAGASAAGLEVVGQGAAKITLATGREASGAYHVDTATVSIGDVHMQVRAIPILSMPDPRRFGVLGAPVLIALQAKIDYGDHILVLNP